MNDKKEQPNLSHALSLSVKSDLGKILSDLTEATLDSFLEEGVLKEIPLLSTVVSAYKIGKGVREGYYLKKLALFVARMNQGMADEKDRAEYIKRITDDTRKRNTELEYILVLIDRYLHEDKAEMLARLYLAYLQKGLSWDELSKYAETIDRLLPGDYKLLSEGDKKRIDYKTVDDGLLRLVSLGLMVTRGFEDEVAKQKGSIVIPSASISNYVLTEFGKRFVDVLSDRDENGFTTAEAAELKERITENEKGNIERHNQIEG